MFTDIRRSVWYLELTEYSCSRMRIARSQTIEHSVPLAGNTSFRICNLSLVSPPGILRYNSVAFGKAKR